MESSSRDDDDCFLFLLFVWRGGDVASSASLLLSPSSFPVLLLLLRLDTNSCDDCIVRRCRCRCRICCCCCCCNGTNDAAEGIEVGCSSIGRCCTVTKPLVDSSSNCNRSHTTTNTEELLDFLFPPHSCILCDDDDDDDDDDAMLLLLERRIDGSIDRQTNSISGEGTDDPASTRECNSSSFNCSPKCVSIP